MGKCKIISHDGDGLYTVDLLPDFTIIESDIAALTAKLSDIDNVELLQLEVAYLEKKAETDALQSELDALITTYHSTPTPENYAAIGEKIDELGQAVKAEAVVKEPYDAVKARKLAIEKRIDRLNAAITDPAPLQAWCADLSDGLRFRNEYEADDEAGTIELLGEDANGINLQPHFRDDGFYDSTRDGLSTPTASLTPASYYYNRAMLPGWQKWDATYRPGIITGTSGGGWTVTLDSVASGEQSAFIPVNDLDDGVLTGIHAVYMNCNDAAFAIDDHVIIESVWDVSRNRTDTIVGFVDNPQPCDLTGFNYQPFVTGGTESGLHDWQNLQPDTTAASWLMHSPIATDLTADIGNNDVEDWKGVLSSGDNIVVQWEYDGEYIYVDSLRSARVPSFTLTAVGGDTSLTPTGINTAWVTADRLYIYAIPICANKSRHVLRKTITPELTGDAYHVTTNPNGWEVAGPFGPSVLADFDSYGRVYVNASGDEARSMDNWVHGAKRTPQLSAGTGAVWASPLSFYADLWLEESQVDIATPSASSLAGASVSNQFNGLIGGYLYQQLDTSTYSYRAGLRTCSGHSDSWQEGHRTDTWDESYSGSYAVAVGYSGDTAGYCYIIGSGSYSRESNYDNYQTCETGCGGGDQMIERREADGSSTSSAGGYGTFYDPDFVTWTLPHNVTDETQTTTIVAAAAACDYVICDNLVYAHDLERTLTSGVIDQANVTDAMYKWIGTDAYSLSDEDMANDTDCNEGVRYQESLQHELGKVRLSNVEFNHSKTTLDTSGTTDPYDPNINFSFWEVITGAYTPGTDPNVSIDTTSSAKTNVTSIAGPLLSFTSRFVLNHGAKDHNDNYLNSHLHQYEATAALVYEDYLTNGDLDTLNELDDGDGVVYRAPHVVV